MGTRTEPDLNARVAAWRQAMAQRNAFDEAALDELESHLWDEIDRLLDAGVPERQAVLQASLRLGHADVLAHEYRKVTEWSRTRRPVWQHPYWTLVMWKNYFKIALRNLRKQAGYSFINIGGLGLGLAFCILIAFFITDEFSYDRFHENADRLYQMHRVPEEADFIFGKSVSLPYLLGPALMEMNPEVEAFARFMAGGQALVRRGNASFTETNYVFADGAVFDMFSFPFQQGNSSTALTEPMGVILNETLARRYFGEANALGQVLQIRLGSAFHDFRVTGVMDDLPANSTLQFNMLISMESAFQTGVRNRARIENWMSSSPYTYVMLREGADVASVEARMPAFMDQHLGELFAMMRERGDWDKSTPPFLFHLQPLPDVHLNPDVPGSFTSPNSPTRSYLLAAIAIGLLLIACINFMTLAVGRSTQRAKEIGVRKAIGAHRAQIRTQFWGEALVMTTLSMMVGLLLALALLPLFNNLTDKTLSLGSGGFLLWIMLVGLLAFTGLVAGSYPALVLSGLHPIESLRGRLRLRGPGGFTQVLVGLQFTLSILLIIGTLGVSRQLNFLLEKELGYNDEFVVAIPAQGIEGDRLLEIYKDALATAPDVLAVTGMNNTFGRGRSRRGMEYEGQIYEPVMVRIEHSFLDAMQMRLIAGRDFNPGLATDSVQSVIVNEAFVRTLGLANPVGTRLDSLSWGRLEHPTIIGVVEDFHVESLHNEIRPTVLTLNPDEAIRWTMVRLKPDDVSRSLANLEGIWQQIVPDVPFQYSFVDEDMAAFYAEEQQWSKIVGYSAFFAILVACLGLFSLAALAVAARTKEIGVRKVFGASVPSLALLLTKEFVVIVLVAMMLSTPVAWLMLQKMMASYPYRASLPWWLFVGAGVLALIAALATVSYQTLRAARANPIDALRYE